MQLKPIVRRQHKKRSVGTATLKREKREESGLFTTTSVGNQGENKYRLLCPHKEQEQGLKLEGEACDP